LIPALVTAADPAPKGSALPQHPFIPGFERFHAAPDGEVVRGGQLLLGELNCTSCHKPEAALDGYIVKKEAPLLDGVGGRVKRGFLKRFLTNPQAVKPGTTMPDLFAHLPEKDRDEKVEALVHFLASTGTLKQEGTQKKLISNGKDLYQKVGCVVCHGTRDALGNAELVPAGCIPLPDLKSKYSIVSLKGFLENPHAVRPSGRMPGLLNAQEAADVTHYLLQGATLPAQQVNMAYAYYEGNYDKLPDFDKLKPSATGECGGFDLSLAHRPTFFAMKFEGYLKVDSDGDYKFHLTSDDGSKLFLDGKLVVDNDGVHAPMTKSGSIKLTKGMHKLLAGVFNADGGVELGIDIEGPGVNRQSALPFVFMTEKGNPKPAPVNKDDEETFPIRQELAAKGRELFGTAGCASCHTLRIDGKPVEARLKAKPLAKLTRESGCLEKKPVEGLPWYSLHGNQRSALSSALGAPMPEKKLDGKELVVRAMTRFNCYGCHEREKIGGPEAAVNKFILTVQPEMGEEGRVPPSLDGVGAKLNQAYLKQVLDNGSHDRPYMHTRMPRFGAANVDFLAAVFEALDKQAPPIKVDFAIPPTKVKAEGRHLVGDKALGCIKCHTFAGQKAEGIQGIDMTLMTQRVKHDWFYAYLVDPQGYRPGTRMPSAWPNGQSPLPKVLDGDSAKQIESIWLYLADGKRAALPSGMKKNSIPLVPDKDAIIYRNFIEGGGSRAVGVGYPERLNLAFDANEMRLAMIWQGLFMDASRHWTDRGAGYEPPAGDNVLHLPAGPSFAVLEKDQDPWPAKPARESGFQFKGYTLSDDQRPTFRYAFHDLMIEDFPNPIESKKDVILKRTLTVRGDKSAENLYFLAAVGKKIEDAGEGWYRIDGEWKVKVESSAAPTVRKVGDKMELIVPVRLKDGSAKIVQEFAW
jgi:mono/diheme cytochrome c family protein